MIKKGLVIADAGPIFSLAIIDKLHLLNDFFHDVKIPRAVWDEITLNKKTDFYTLIDTFFKDKILEIHNINDLSFIMDYGESEAIILYQELNAEYLLIDDKKARDIAENYDISCVGTLGILINAKEKGFINELKPIFKTLLLNNRYYGLNLLNNLLKKYGETAIELK